MFTSGADAYRMLLHEVHRADLLSRRAADLQLGEQLGIGRAMFLLLETIATAPPGPTSQQSLARHLGLTKAAVSRHVLAGEERGWIATRRSPDSLREKVLTLTSSGRQLVRRGRRQRDMAGMEVTAVLGIEEMRQTTESLRRLSQHLEDRAGAVTGRRFVTHI